MNEYIDHFSHDHRLRFFQVDEDEDPKPYRCNICGLPILSSPSYTCSNDAANCNFFVHKPCTQLPTQVYHKFHSSILALEQPKSASVGESCQNFTYKCGEYDDTCKFEVHALVAKPVEIKTKHRSHEHPLVAICKEISCVCDGCEEEQKGFFFHCGECNFWIHNDCTVLPSILKLPSHPHPFFLTYDQQYVLTHNKIYNCSFCHRSWRSEYSGVYFCGECESFAHLNCAKSLREFLTETKFEFIKLPDDEETRFPSLVIRKSVERNPFPSQNEDKKCHEHPLILKEDEMSRKYFNNLVCDVCVQPIHISSPFYRCQFSPSCHFLAHQICHNQLPATVKLHLNSFIRELPVSFGLVNYSHCQEYFSSVFTCFRCSRPSNGLFYYNKKKRMTVDVECAVAPKTMKHASHKQHILYQHNNWAPQFSCCFKSYFSDCSNIYRCTICPYYIHIRCALLPKRSRHKFDEHTLELIMTAHDNEVGQEYFCEVCEEDINRRYWYYGCGKCEQYFHIKCIPSVGHLSKVKFGKSIADNKIHRLDHPLTLTRMLTVPRNERCGACNQIIKGFVDEMAFHCYPCHFWIHFSCV